jgi:hypothetical protein
LFARHDTAGVARLLDEARNLDARQSQIAARYVATFLRAAGVSTAASSARRNSNGAG